MELGSRGFRVVGFWNVDVFQNIEGVIDMVRYEAGLPTMVSYEAAEARREPPPLTPPHKGEGNR